MSEELIDSYIDRSGIADDTKFLTDQLKAVLELFEKVNATKITLNVATGLKETTEAAKESQKAMDNLTAGKEKLIKVDLELIRSIKEQALGNRALNESYQDLVKVSVQNEIAGNKLKEQRRLLNKDFKDGLITNEQYTKALEDMKEAENALKVSNLELGRAMRNMEKEAQASEGSLNQLRAQLNQALQAFDALSAEEKKSNTGVALKQKIVEITEAVSAEEEATKRFQRNVGNYPASAKIIVDALEKARQKFEILSKAADTTPAALEDARRGFESLRNVVDDRQFIKYAAAAGDAQKEVKAFTRVLVQMEQNGEGNSQAAIDLRKHLAELTDQVGDARAEIKALSSDTHSFDQFAGAVNFAVDTVQTFVGAMSLSADSEQDVQEATKTLIALQTVSNGIKGIATELTTRGTLANKIYAFAQNQVAIAMDTTATAGARLKGALVTLGIGALIIGIGLLIANFDKIKRAITGVSKEQEALNDVMKEAGSEYANAVKTVNQLKINIDLAKQGFIEKEKVIKEYNDSIGKTTGQVKSLDEAEKQLIEKGDAYIQMTLKKAIANIALEKAAQKAFEAEEKKRKEAEEFLTTADKATGFGAGNVSAPGFVPNLQTQATKIAIQYNKEQSEKRKQAAIKESTDEQKTYTDIANEATKAAAGIAKKFSLNYLGDNKSVQQSAQTQKFRDGILKDDADLYKKLSENQDAYLITRLSAREKSFEIEKQILAGQKAAEIENINSQLAIEKQRASIGEVSKEELAQKEKEASNKRSEINKDYAEKQTLLEININRDLLTIRQSFIAKQRELDEQYNNDFKKDQEDRLNASIESIQKEQLRRLSNNTEGQAAEIKALNDRYEKIIAATREGSKKRQRIDEQYAHDRAEIEYRYAVAAVKNEIWAAEQILAVHKAAGINVADEEKKIADLKKELSDSETKHALDNEHRKYEAFQKRMQQTEDALGKAQEIESKVADVVGGFINASVDKQKAAVQGQIDDIDKKKEKEIEAVNSSASTEKEKADKIAIINARSAAQKEALERKQRQLDLQRARFEKAANITRIAIETNLAVVHQLASGDPYTAIGRAIAAGVLGAAQLAVAIAQPLPKFKTGRKGGPATFGIVGDGGVPEVVTSPDLSQAFLTPATDTGTYLPKNWNVFPNVKEFQETAMNMLHKPLPTLPIIQNNNDGMMHAMAYSIGRLERAIMNKRETHFHWNNGELRKSIQNGNDWLRYIQDSV
jgi:hypothetical protein